jgi:oxygen-independent coproporphyrinogen-3 oxidase
VAGIYLHIPFCRKACHYCNFHFSTRLQNKNEVVKALLKEIAMEADTISMDVVHTLYFGGGTPSLLEEEELQALMEQLHQHFSIAADAEITLEANPDDLIPAKLAHWKALGINRLSIGVQSFREEDLRWMNRAHTATEALEGIRRAQAMGFYNLTIDLIYGTPGLTDEAWRDNITQAVALEIPHLSCYALTVEPKTALHHMVDKKQVADVDPDQQARQFLILMEAARAAGYEHYEVSNFSRPGWRSRHNSAYWQGRPYLGIGPGAHSYDVAKRRWNVANNALYISGISAGAPIREEETLSARDRYNEYIMTALRTMEGIQLNAIRLTNGEDQVQQLIRQAATYASRGLLITTNEAIRLTDEGKLFADGIAADFFLDE